MNMDEILQSTSNPFTLDPKKAIDLEKGMNQGVIAPTRDELEKVGAEEPDASGLSILAPDANWDSFMSPFDSQLFTYFDTLGCNIFSSVHSVESIVNAMGGDSEYIENGKTEFGERAACVAAGLDGNSGSSEAQWENMIKAQGLIKESLWPDTPNISKADFFMPLPQDIKARMKLFLDHYDPSFRQIGTDLGLIKEALKYAPVKIFIGTGFGWNNREPNIIPRTSNPMNHAVMVRKITNQGIHIYDQYAPFLKILAPNYRVDYAFQTLLTKKGDQMFLANDKGTVYLITGNQDKRKIGIADLNSLGLFGDEPQTPMDTSGIPEYNTIVDAKKITHK